MTTSDRFITIVVLVIFVGFWALVLGLWYHYHPVALPDAHSIEICKQYAPITAKGFVGTQFEHFDFYKSCIANITETSPVISKPSPTPYSQDFECETIEQIEAGGGVEQGCKPVEGK